MIKIEHSGRFNLQRPEFLGEEHRQLFIDGLKSFQHLIPRGRWLSYGQFADLIRKHYSLEEPRTECIWQLFKKLQIIYEVHHEQSDN